VRQARRHAGTRISELVIFGEHMNGSYSDGPAPSTTDPPGGSPRRLPAPNLADIEISNRDSAQPTMAPPRSHSAHPSSPKRVLGLSLPTPTARALWSGFLRLRQD
jgi:hypothetical protein